MKEFILLLSTVDRHARAFLAVALSVIALLGAVSLCLYRSTPTLHIFFSEIMTTFAASLLIALAGTLLLDAVYRTEERE